MHVKIMSEKLQANKAEIRPAYRLTSLSMKIIS
jgi:hypothetical protein